jgi:predicted amidohydrolase
VIVTVAVVQHEPPSTFVEAIELTRRFAVEARSNGATVVAFPETWIPGYPAWLDVCRDVALWNHPPVKAVFRRMAEESVDVHGESGKRIADIARDLGVTLVTGICERVGTGPGNGTLYNTILIHGPDGSLLNHHRKLMPTYTERMVWGTGDADGLRSVDTPSGRVGALVCWEHWMPLARQAMHDCGEDIHVALWPTVHEAHQLASRQYAFEGRCFVLAAGSLLRASALPAELVVHPDRAPTPDTFVLRGGSAIIGPDGHYLQEPVYERPVILYAALDLDRLREERMSLDVSGHYARPDLFTFQVKRDSRVSTSS